MKKQFNLPFSKKPLAKINKGFRLEAEYVQFIEVLKTDTRWTEAELLQRLINVVGELLIMDPHGLPSCVGDFQAAIKSARKAEEIRCATQRSLIPAEADARKRLAALPSIKRADYMKQLRART